MAGEAPAHAQRFYLPNLFHVFHFAVAEDAIEAPFDVALMGEIDMGRQIVHFVPGHGLLVVPIFGQFDNFGPIGRHVFMAFHAHRHGRNPWFGRFFHIGMAVSALQPHIRDVSLMTERNRLVWRLAIGSPEIAQ